MALTGQDIINALNELKEPASVTEIVTNLQSKRNGSGTNLLEETKILLEAGVRFGSIIEERKNFRCNDISSSTKEIDEHKNKEINRIISSTDHTNIDKDKETAMRNNGISSPTDRIEKLENKRKSTTEIEQNVSSEEDDNDENDYDDTADCYGPSYRRRRSRSRSRRRNKSSKRNSSRRRRKHP